MIETLLTGGIAPLAYEKDFCSVMGILAIPYEPTFTPRVW